MTSFVYWTDCEDAYLIKLELADEWEKCLRTKDECEERAPVAVRVSQVTEAGATLTRVSTLSTTRDHKTGLWLSMQTQGKYSVLYYVIFILHYAVSMDIQV